jgi:hypothetical protein
MDKVIVDLSMSLDGYIAGPNDGRGNPLGVPFFVLTHDPPVALEQVKAVESDGVTHLRFLVGR